MNVVPSPWRAPTARAVREPGSNRQKMTCVLTAVVCS
jgi:hypothetical protein